MLDGKRATGSEGVADRITEGGGIYTEAAVETDGQVVTGSGADIRAFTLAVLDAVAKGPQDRVKPQKIWYL